jgi:thiamine biosynthesis lipoprotein
MGATLAPPAFASHREDTFRWQGLALGAEAQMTLVGLSQTESERLLKKCLIEIERLERVFSLYIPNSAIRRLNRKGRLLDPPIELLEVLDSALMLAAQTSGRFDVTIQPLFHYLYFLGDNDVDPEHLRKLLTLIDYRRIRVSSRELTFDNSSMQITLNGLAQGYITDRISNLLRHEGVENQLVQLGESFGLGHNSLGDAWRLKLSGGSDDERGSLVDLNNTALATSEPHGTMLRPKEKLGHLIDARTGMSIDSYKSVSVLGPSALVADGLSTALSLLSKVEQLKLMAQYPKYTSLVFTERGQRYRIGEGNHTN